VFAPTSIVSSLKKLKETLYVDDESGVEVLGQRRLQERHDGRGQMLFGGSTA
jgi:hypothetical protein